MLSKETTDQIRKEAEDIYKYHPIDAEKKAYIKGCETWAVWKEKAEVYEKALISIKTACFNLGHAEEIATKALEQFHEETNKIEMIDGLYQVTTNYLCAGFIVKDGKVIDCAPILKAKIKYWITIAKLIKP